MLPDLAPTVEVDRRHRDAAELRPVAGLANAQVVPAAAGLISEAEPARSSAALVIRVSLPVTVPVVLESKVTLKLWLWAGVSETGAVIPERANPVPEI